jgi:hypothetical protein
MPLPTFSSVVYLSPWLPQPPGWNKVGLDVLVSASGAPAGTVLAGRLRQGATTVQVVVASIQTEVVITPLAPLSAMLDYYVDVMWVPSGTQPNNVNWGASGPSSTYSTAPVVTAIASLAQGSISGANVGLIWNFGAAAITPAGANLSAFTSGGTSAGFARVQGTSGSLPLNNSAAPGTQLYLQAVMPISGAPGTGFAAPFSMGPIVSGLPLPLAAPAIISAAYDREKILVGWTAPAAPATGGTIGYDLLVSLDGLPGMASVFEAGADGGMAAVGGGDSQSLQVAGRVRIGAIVGAPGSAIALLPLPPVIDKVQVSGSKVNARATFPSSTPAGAKANLELRQNGVVKGSAAAASSGATVALAGFVPGSDGWTVTGSMTLTLSGAALTGPPSAPATVLTAAPVIADVLLAPAPGGGWTATVDAAAPAPANALLNVTLQQDSVIVAQQDVGNGTRASFSLTQAGTPAVGKINGAAVAQAILTVTDVNGVSPAATATFIGSAPAAQSGAAPVISAVQNIGPNDPSGLPQGLQIDVAAAVSGQTLVVRLTGNGSVLATSSGSAGGTHVNLPLSQALDPSILWRVEARWTGSGVDSSTFGGWSAPVAVLTATTNVVAADFEEGMLTLEIQPPQGGSAQGAYFYAYASGQLITGINAIGTRGSFALTPGAASWQAGAKPFQPLPAGATSRTLAPSSALVPLLLAAPTLQTVSYDGAVLSATWSAVNDTGGSPATGASILVANQSGSIATGTAGSTSGEIAILLPPSGQGETLVSVRATRTARGVAASGAYSSQVAPLIASPAIGSVALNSAGTSVTAAITAPDGMPSGTTYRAWLKTGERVVAGPVSGTGSVTFSYAALGVSGLAIVAQAQATVSGVALTGPLSAPAPVLAFAPGFVSVNVTSGDPTHWLLDARWLPPADGAAIVTYWLKLAAGNQEAWSSGFGSATSGSHSFLKSGIGASTAYTLSLWAVSANGSTTPVAATSFWFAAPAFASVAVGKSQVNAKWTAPTGPTGISYRLSLIDNASSAVLAATTSDATSAGIDIAGLGLSASGSYTLALAVLSGPVLFDAGSDGTAKTRPILLLQRPLELAIATDPKTGKATLSWQGVTAPTGYTAGYTLAFSDRSAPVAVSTTSYTFAAALAAGTDFQVTVTATFSKDGVASAGPSSAPLTVPTESPDLTSANYDGARVRASWQPVAGAAYYVTTVLNAAGNVATTGPRGSATTTSFAASLAAADGPFTLIVQAATQAGTGLPSAPLHLFRTAWFVSTQATDEQPPHVYPAATMALQPAKISIYLPPLAAGTVTVAPVGPFALTGNTDPATKTAFPYILSFASDSAVWNFGSKAHPVPPIRPQLQSDYVAFLQAAETAHAAPWGVATLQLAISRWMPQTFAESHYYAYGLSLAGGQGKGSIDLRPGLVLRVSFADYTNVWSGSANSWLNGFGGGSPSDFDVVDSLSGAGSWMLSMDSFIAGLTASGAMAVSPPTTLVSASTAAGVADAADLFFPGFPNPFYRLFFPGQLQNPTSTGSVATTANFALASADSFTHLSTSSPTAGANAPVVYFRGRAVLRVMIRVRVNDMELIVPLGTTIGNILDRYGVRPPASKIQLTGVVLDRAAGPGIAIFGDSPSPPALVYDSAARHGVRLDWATMATYGGPFDATSLPLLHGDRIGF